MPPARQTPDSESTAWRPGFAGEVLDGIVTDVDSAWSDYRARADSSNPEAGWYPLLTIRPTVNADAGEVGDEVTVHAFRTVLYNEILRRQPQVGEHIEITYVGQGKDPGNGMSPAEVYKVKMPDRTGANGPNPYTGFAPAKGPGAAAATTAPGAADQGELQP